MRRMKFSNFFIVFGLLIFLQWFLLSAADGQEKIGDQTCLDCHEDHALPETNVHQRLISQELGGIERGCESCHGSGEVHVNEGDPDMIRSFSKLSANESSQACLTCHRSLQAMDWNLGDHAVSEIACADCHSIHQEKDRARSDPQLCLDCHKEILVKANFPSHHPVREGKMTCSSCHQHHGSVMNNLKTHERLNDMCLTCHADKQGPFIFEHAPVQEDCTICHNAHGTVANNLLKQNEPFLCLQCHESHFHAGRLGLTHPKTLPAGGFSENPFGEAGWRRAFLTKCSQCHFRIHGSDNPSQTVPGKGKGIIR
jgi:DmsE family decaheme c-type cytochrome